MKKENNKKNIRSNGEKQDWNELCLYVKKNILKYEDNMGFPKHLALRLMGLSQGKYIANNSIENQAKYSFKIILYTFKVCKDKINNYLYSNQTNIQDENHKINLVMKFVEAEINDVYLRCKNAQKNSTKTLNANIAQQESESADYKTKKNDVSDKLNKLW